MMRHLEFASIVSASCKRRSRSNFSQSCWEGKRTRWPWVAPCSIMRRTISPHDSRVTGRDAPVTVVTLGVYCGCTAIPRA